MSDFYLNTGKTKTEPCQKCGTSITYQQQKGAATNHEFWSPPSHNSPCGLPCFGAGVRGVLYRTGQFHNGPDLCPTCKPGTLGRVFEETDGA